MIAYFFSAPGHLEKLQSNFARTSQTGIDWSNTVKTYVKTKAYPRAPNHPDVNVIWNGEVPELVGGGFACSIHPGFRKRQDPASVCGPSASPSPTLNTASIQSAQSVASVQSIASLASLSSASVASLESIASTALPGLTIPLTTQQTSFSPSSIAAPSSPPSTTAAPPAPPPPSSTAEAPQATCTAITKLNSVDVAIWTNYITDDGAALEAAEKDTCPGVGVTNWSVTSISRVWTAPDGTQWTANQEFQFSLTRVTHPTVLQCISKAIIKAGGPADTQDCPFTSGVGVP
jgi:hypothetical protein